MEKKFGKTCEMMEVFCFVISVIDLSRHKGWWSAMVVMVIDDDDDDEKEELQNF
jgi:hypothetical protein